MTPVFPSPSSSRGRSSLSSVLDPDSPKHKTMKSRRSVKRRDRPTKKEEPRYRENVHTAEANERVDEEEASPGAEEGGLWC